jgi:outer membrane lipoprotein-sorting protein
MVSMTAYRPAWLRWLVPALAVLATTAGAAALKTAASAEPRLPARSAAQLLVDLQTARVDGLSGLVTERADLGLPSLPSLSGGNSSDLSSLLTGTHTLRIWYSGPNSARVALLGTLGESDVITNGKDVWTWSSADNTATHRVLSDRPEKVAPVDPQHPAMTPQQAADAALAAVDPTTAVTTAGPVRVAGRSSYELVLAPRDNASLISQVRIAIDAEKHVPLRVRVYGQGADPAIEVAFTQVSFARPAAEQFRFNPPPGAKVEEATKPSTITRSDGVKPDAGPQRTKNPKLRTDTSTKPADDKQAIVGKGWTAVFVTRAALPTAKAANGSPSITGMLDRLPAVSGSWGSGHLMSGNLFSVLVTSDGRLLIGAVRPERLYEAAADPAAALK